MLSFRLDLDGLYWGGRVVVYGLGVKGFGRVPVVGCRTCTTAPGHRIGRIMILAM